MKTKKHNLLFFLLGVAAVPASLVVALISIGLANRSKDKGEIESNDEWFESELAKKEEREG